jgi:hypothetical protein
MKHAIITKKHTEIRCRCYDFAAAILLLLVDVVDGELEALQNASNSATDCASANAATRTLPQRER